MKINQEKAQFAQEKADKLRKLTLEMALKAGKHGAHFGSTYSIAEIMATLFFGTMQHDPKNMDDPDRDRFILSKGHGALALYICLALSGYFSEEMLFTFENKDSLLPAHPCLHRNLGIEFATGSLGHGLSLGLGTAFAARLDKRDYHTYVLVGDGECNEGSIWEAAMLAGHLGLDNLTVIIDRNHMQSDGFSNEVLDMGDMRAKWTAFGWHTLNVEGHDTEALLEALHGKNRSVHQPRALIAHTTKGKGVGIFENNNYWHHQRIDQEMYDKVLDELKSC